MTDGNVSLLTRQRPQTGLLRGLETLVPLLGLNAVPRPTRAIRVLVIEDDQTLREVIADALRDDGYAVAAADNGIAGLQAARRSPPDLAIVDLMLPGMSGEEFCAAAREIDDLAGMRLVIVSASRNAYEAGERAGAVATIRKPFDLFELMDRINALLGR